MRPGWAAMSDDVWDNLLQELQIFKARLEAMEPALSRRIRHGGVQKDLADELGISPQELDGAFLEDEQPQEETPLLRRLRRGCDE